MSLNISEECRLAVQQNLARAAQRTNAVKAQLEQASRLQDFWERLIQYMEQDLCFHIAWWIEKEKALWDALPEGSPNIGKQLQEIAVAAKATCDTVKRRYPSLLEAACREANLPIDMESRHPRYTFEKGFFLLELNEVKGMAKLSDHEGRLELFPADIHTVIRMVQLHHQRVFGRNFDGPRFLKKLRKQYLQILKKENREDGDSIGIRQITARLGKNEKGFRSDEFLVDVSRLMEKGPFHVDGRKIDFQQTKDTNQGMLPAGGRGYINLILFGKE